MCDSCEFKKKIKPYIQNNFSLILRDFNSVLNKNSFFNNEYTLCCESNEFYDSKMGAFSINTMKDVHLTYKFDICISE